MQSGHEGAVTPAAWLVRGGRHGEREDAALRDGLVIAGWDEVDDLRNYTTKREVRQVLSQEHPDVSNVSVGLWAGQLWSIFEYIKNDDFVVMPLKTRPQQIAIGRIDGPYYYDLESEPGFRHVRPVKWIHSEVPKEAVQQDLLNSMGSLLTVCRLQRYGAARRIAYIAEHSVDPGANSDERPEVGVSTQRELLDKVTASDSDNPLRLTIRELLSVWGASRRTPAKVAEIESDLAELGITTRPPFTEDWIDNVVDILPVGEEPDNTGESDPHQAVPATEEASDYSDSLEITWRIGMLQPANQKVAHVSPKDTLEVAMTTMVADNYSQLAVIDDKNHLHGAVSWESIGKARISRSATCVDEAAVSAQAVDHSKELFSQVGEIYQNGYVFVRDADGNITGIVTAADLTSQFGYLVRPFLLVEEAERRLRKRADEVFALDELRSAVPKNFSGKIGSAADLTLGNYEYLLQPVERWEKLGWPLDHKLFLERLNKVRLIRNELMHFHPDPLSDEDLGDLHGIVRMLRAVDPLW